MLGLRPTLPPFTPPDFRQLVEHCWHQEPKKRPTFEFVLDQLIALRQALGIGRTPPLQPNTLRVREAVERAGASNQVIMLWVQFIDIYCEDKDGRGRVKTPTVCCKPSQATQVWYKLYVQDKHHGLQLKCSVCNA